MKWIKINKYTYNSNIILSLGVQDILPSFGIITVIAVDENDEFYFIINKLETLRFCSHFYAYEVNLTEHFLLLKLQDIGTFNYFTLVKKIADGNLYVVYD